MEKDGTERGFVFATTGRGYLKLARRAARSLRAVCPHPPIDLFTDQEVDDPVFARVVRLETDSRRPKIEALLRSRFERTICLDADILVLADISDVFDVLERFDMAMVQEQFRNHAFSTAIWRRHLPPAWPQFNSGLVGIRRSTQVDRLLGDWQRAMLEGGLKRDQPVLRELLFDSALRVAVLPPEYNLMSVREMGAWTSDFTAPRVIHHHVLHRHIGKKMKQVETVEDLLGRPMARHLQRLLEADQYLAPGNSADYVPAMARNPQGQPPFRHTGTPLGRLLGRIAALVSQRTL